MTVLCFRFHQNHPTKKHIWLFVSERGRRGPPISNLILIGKHMIALCFKFHQNRTLNKELGHFFGGWATPHLGQNSKIWLGKFLIITFAVIWNLIRQKTLRIGWGNRFLRSQGEKVTRNSVAPFIIFLICNWHILIYNLLFQIWLGLFIIWSELF